MKRSHVVVLRNITTVILLLVATASLGYGVVKTLRPNGSIDLQHPALSLLVKGENPYKRFTAVRAVPMSREERDASEFPFERIPHYPPSGMTFMLPLGLVSLATSQRIMAVFDIAFAILIPILAVVLLLRESGEHSVDRRRVVEMTAALAIVSPLSFLIFTANPLMLSVVALFVALLVRNDVLSGVALAIALIKYPLTGLFFLIFLMDRRFWPMIYAVAIHVALHVFWSICLGTDPLSLMRDVLAVNRTGLAPGYSDTLSLFKELGIEGMVWPLALGALLVLLCAAVLYHTRNVEAARPLRIPLVATTALTQLYHNSYDSIVFVSLVAWAAFGQVNWRSPLNIWVAGAGLIALVNCWILNRFSTVTIPGLLDADAFNRVYSAMFGAIPTNAKIGFPLTLFVLLAIAAAMLGAAREAAPATRVGRAAVSP